MEAQIASIILPSLGIIFLLVCVYFALSWRERRHEHVLVERRDERERSKKHER